MNSVMLLRLLTWPYVRRHVLRWTLTLAGIVLGVSVFVAMHTANQSIFRSFDQTIDQIAGATQLQVSAGEFGFDESVLEKVQSVAEVGIAVPVIESTVETRIASQGSLLLLGIDLTGDRNLRNYDLKDADYAIIDDPLVFLAQPDSLMVTREFSARNGIGVNSKIGLITVDGEKQFTVRGIMASEGLAQAFGGNLIMMDIYAAQHVLGRGRRFDRIDIRAREDVRVEECQEAVRRALGPGLEIDTPSARGKHFEALLLSYSNAVTVSSLFALIVGMFIIYNSFAIAVAHRRSEIGVLRALGATRGQIQKLFFIESVFAGTIGSLAGVLLGLFGAVAVARYMSALIEYIGGGAQRVAELEVNPGLLTVATIIGILTSIFAAWIPARNAAGVDPVQALQKGKYQVLSAGENRLRRRVGILLVIISGMCLFFSDSKITFYSGYILMIISGLVFAPALTLLLSKAVRPALRQILPAEGTLAADSLVRAPRRTSATVAALMLSMAMVVGFGGFTHSFYKAVDDWMNTFVNPDFFVSPSANLTTRAITFPSEYGQLVRSVAGVDHVEVVRAARIVFRDIPVMVIAFESDRPVPRLPLEGTLEEMNHLTAEGKGLIAAGAFASIHKLKLGDVVDLPTPSGRLSLPIVGIVKDYSDMQGSVFIDRTVYVKWWNDDTANLLRVYVKHEQNVDAARQRVIDALAGRQRLLVLTNREVHEWIVKVFDQWFAMTYSQIGVAILVAVLGIVNTLTVSIIDRRRELGVMLAVGSLRSQIRRTVWIEALSIGFIGLILGIALGSVNLYYTLGMVQRDLGGLTLDYIFPVSFVTFMVPTILAAAFVAAIGPGESALRTNLVDALGYE